MMLLFYSTDIKEDLGFNVRTNQINIWINQGLHLHIGLSTGWICAETTWICIH